MAYRFQLDESFRDGFVRIGLEQIERAQQRLKSLEDRAVAIHDTRKGLKRIRALLRLARPGLGDKVFRRENARFREIAGMLAGVRDRQVLAETLAKLEQRSSPKATAAIGEFRALLAEKEGTPAHRDDGAVKKALAALEEAHRSFGKLKLSAGFAAIAPGLEDCYRRGCKAFAAAYDEPSDEAFHEWRKTVQQHWRHMALLSRAWPDVMSGRVAEARKLSELLGEDHDLALLKALVAAKVQAKDGIRRALARDMDGLCRQRQRELRAAALLRGRRLFAQSPKDLRRQTALYWKAACRMAGEKAEQPEVSLGRSSAPRLPMRRTRKPAQRT